MDDDRLSGPWYPSWGSETTWTRPTAHASQPRFMDDGASRFDVIQGVLPNSGWLAAVGSLTLNKDLLSWVVPNNQSFEDDYAGIFHFR